MELYKFVADNFVFQLRKFEFSNGFIRCFENIQLAMLILSMGSAIFIFIAMKRWFESYSSNGGIYSRLTRKAFRTLLKVPFIGRKVEREMDIIRNFIKETINKYDSDIEYIEELPDDPMDSSDILSRASKHESMSEFEEGKISGAIYTPYKHNEHTQLLAEVFKYFAYSNPLHPDVFPGCRKMEAEIIRIVGNLYNGDENVTGSMTTGGTESILLAMLSYRNLAKSNGINKPEMIIPVTVHAAFLKASEFFNIGVRVVKVTSEHRVNIEDMQRAINKNTCVIVGSAPNFPTGTIDDIQLISEIGAKHGVPVHVDACLGGFLIPFMEECGFPMSLFDFRLEGVTSISCDMHKYGYAVKGSSVILYRNKTYLHHQYSSFPDWTGGIYATPTLAGSRCGMSIALTWATLLHIGRKGYIERTKMIIESARAIASGIKGDENHDGIEGLKLLGSPDVSVVAFASDVINIYDLMDCMGTLGWNLNSLQNPAALHICVTYNSVMHNVADMFLQDLRVVVRKLLDSPKGASKTAAIYGLAASLPDKCLINDITHMYLDACVTIPKQEH